MTVKKEHLFNIQGTEFIKFAGLLDEAHQQGLCGTRTTLIQIPDEHNGHTAIVAAEVDTSKGTFGGLGDASPSNVGRMIAPHIIRMAETRAIARAMRIAVNIGATSVEELISPDEVGQERQPAQPAAQNPAPPPSASNGEKAQEDRELPATPAQIETIEKLLRLLDRPKENLEGINKGQAGARISALSRDYNKAKGRT